MRSESELLDTLRAATALVADAVARRISLREFAERYGSFYYFEALDGHEADAGERALLAKHAEVVRLHEQVQRTVVDLIYAGPEEQKAQYLAAGRIDEAEAVRRLASIAERFGVE